MNDVHISTTLALFARRNELEGAVAREDHQKALWGTADRMQSIATSVGGRPNCTSGLIWESEEREGVTGHLGQHMYRNYEINPNGILTNIPNATKDEVNLFMVLARPDVLNTEGVQDAITARLDTIHKEETISAVMTHSDKADLENKQEIENNTISSIFDCVKDAVHVEAGDRFYPAGYEMDQLPE